MDWARWNRCILWSLLSWTVIAKSASAQGVEGGNVLPNAIADGAPETENAPAVDAVDNSDDETNTATAGGASDDEESTASPEESSEPIAPCVGPAIDGVVVDARSGETLIEAPVSVLNHGRTLTDENGHFHIALRPGRYSLRARYDFFNATRLDNVVVQAGRCTELRVELSSSELTADEMVVDVRADVGSNASVLRARRESSNVQDGLSAEEMRRSSDSDAGQAARRVVGASVVGGQYLFVRGLGGRYTTTLLNGSFLPSTDPDQPGVQLDLFPAAILNGLTVQKTFSPDLPGDATGGAMLLATREMPTRFTLNVSLSLTLNTETSFTSAPVGQGGSVDALGYDDGTRFLPGSVPQRRPLVAGSDLSQDQVVATSRTFAPTWRITDSTALPSGRATVSLGDTVRLFDRPLGYFLNLLYSNQTQVLRNERVSRVFLSDPTTGATDAIPERRRNSTTNNVQWGALGTMRYSPADHSDLTLTLLWSQNAESYTGVLSGYDANDDQNTRQSRVRWVERSLYFAQLAGDHQQLPGNMRWRWQLAGSLGSRWEPDTRDMLYIANRGDDNYFWRNAPGSGERLFLSLDQTEVGASTDLSIPIETLTVRFGGAMRAQERGFQLRRFIYQAGPGFDPSLAALPPEQLFSASNINENLFLRETTGGRDSYRASQLLTAAFAMVDWNATEWLRWVGGVRVEGFRQTVASRTLSGISNNDPTVRTDVDAMPSLQGIVKFSPELFLRAGYGGTVARPQIRELAPFLYPDFIRLRNILGNASLTRSRIHNFDLRLEYFPSADEVVAISGFVKSFERPIEMIAFANSTFSYDNVEGALNGGVELEGRLSLARLTSALRGLDVGLNLTFVHSQVSLSEAQRQQTTNVSRPMAGQSPWIVNASLQYAPPDTGVRLRAIYNVFGPRILEVGRERLPDVYQDEFHSLDIVGSYEFHPGLELRASVENVLLDDTVLRQGTHVVQQYNAGLSASLGLSITAN